MTGVFVAVTKKGEVCVAVTGAGAKGVFRAAAIERALSAKFSTEAIESIAIDASSLLSDLHASAAYRANLIKVMAQRAVAAA
jgi:carbon-monoxide dehydrogenase medium subunit